jgi:hypothetical protein
MDSYQYEVLAEMTGFAAKTQVVIARKSIASLSDTGFLIEQAFAALALSGS